MGNTCIVAEQWSWFISIRFNHRFEVFNICCISRLILMPNAKWRALILAEGRKKTNTEKAWLNVIITCSKFISSPFICLFFTIIAIISPSLAPLYKDNIVVSTIETNACDTCHSVDKLMRFWKSTGKSWNLLVKVSGSLLLHDKLLTRVIKMSGLVRT